MKSEQQIDNLCVKYNLQIVSARTMPLTRGMMEIGNGWNNLIYNLIEELIKAGWDGRVYQIKEKYAGLRFYAVACTNEQWDIIEKYEKKSYNICDICGRRGKTVGTGWLYPKCPKHSN